MKSSAVQLASGEQALPRQGRYFLEGLRHIEYGAITILPPQGEPLVFAGTQVGAEAELRLKDWGVLDDLVARGEIGFAEAYLDARWDSPDVTALLTFALSNTASLEKFFHGKPLHAVWLKVKNALKPNSLRGSKRNIMAHYDLGNAFYSLWLDESMTYSSALFEGDETRTLEEAQQAKYRRILGRIEAAPGMRILEIGCGWGGFALAAAQAGLQVTAITISPQQADYARTKIKQAGYSGQVEILLQDYRELQGRYDRIVSIGMFEHVGEKYWPTYFANIKRLLVEGGKAVVQSITLDDKLFEELRGVTGFIEHYIFPGGMLPSKARFREACGAAGLECVEIYGFGLDYALTLRRWLARFEQNWPEIQALGFDDTFHRLWRFYLCSCIASFESKRTDVMQAALLA
jgi:cyclopropane-fatty-acyl-phospholipid synthase